MINDSRYWKSELLKQANWLHKNAAPPVRSLTGLSLYRFEKCLFLGGFAIRKLLDSEKLSKRARSRSIKVSKYPWKNNPVTLIGRFELDTHYDFGRGERGALSVKEFCNQLIHSYIFLLNFFEPEGGVNGFFLASDELRHSLVYFVKTSEIENLFRVVARDEVKTMNMTRQSNGQWKITTSN